MGYKLVHGGVLGLYMAILVVDNVEVTSMKSF